MKPLTFYPRSVLGKNAITVFPFIWIRRDRKGDAALHAHETQHYVEQGITSCVQLVFALGLYGLQWWLPALVFPWVWLAPYLILPSFRFAAEVRGMRAQIQKTDPPYREALTRRLITDLYSAYETNRSLIECEEALTKE